MIDFKWEDHGDGSHTMLVPVCRPRIEGRRWRFVTQRGRTIGGTEATVEAAKAAAERAYCEWALTCWCTGAPQAGSRLLCHLL
jgi:hypothetical protein